MTPIDIRIHVGVVSDFDIPEPTHLGPYIMSLQGDDVSRAIDFPDLARLLLAVSIIANIADKHRLTCGLFERSLSLSDGHAELSSLTFAECKEVVRILNDPASDFFAHLLNQTGTDRAIH